MELRKILSPDFISLSPKDSVKEVLTFFLQKRQDIACVIKEGALIGIVTKYSLYRLLLRSAETDVPIEGAIIQDIISMREDTNIYRARDIMLNHNIAHAIVTDQDGRVIGILSRANIFQAMITETQNLTKQMSTLMNNLKEAVLSVDLNMQITAANEAAEFLSKESRDSLVSQPVEIVLPDLAETIQEVIATEVTIELTNINIEHGNFVGSFFPIKAWGQINGVMVVLENVSKYEKIASELETTKRIEQTLDSALEAAYDGIVITDSAGVITKVNKGFLDLFSYQDSANILGRKLKEIAPEIPSEKSILGRQKVEGEYIQIRGHKTVVTQTPIYRNEENIGTIIKILFRQLDMWKDLFQHMDRLETTISYYQNELKRVFATNEPFSHIISTSPLINTLKANSKIAADGFSNILITGESGTGKELFADGIHQASGRSGMFIKINCAAIPHDLLESEFFGYEEGAFTGSRKGGKPGKFELADGGTLFLDEIGDMPLALQVKLLRVLQEKEFERIGGTQTIKTDVRILAATNRNLLKMVEEGSFREDLFYRINVIHLRLPPLRDRLEDIPLLSDYFIAKYKRKTPKAILGLTAEAIQLLQTYRWPGNIRELENVLERAFHFCSGEWITPRDVSLDQFERKSASGVQHEKKKLESGHQFAMEEAEKKLILRALADADGNRTAAAKSLGISRSSLYKKINKYEIQESTKFS